MHMNSKKRAYLRKIANGLEPIVRIGKEGLTDNVVKSLADALKARELVKVRLLSNSEEELTDTARELADRTESELIHVMGSTIVYFKENKEKPSISKEL